MDNTAYNSAYSLAINSMAYVDQWMRNRGKQDSSIDKKNARLLLKLTQKLGWPTVSKVGHKSSHNAWLIAQHSELVLMEHFYSMMINHHSDIDPENIIFLEDRILSFKYAVQIHGTQFKKISNEKEQPSHLFLNVMAIDY